MSDVEQRLLMLEKQIRRTHQWLAATFVFAALVASFAVVSYVRGAEAMDRIEAHSRAHTLVRPVPRHHDAPPAAP